MSRYRRPNSPHGPPLPRLTGAQCPGPGFVLNVSPCLKNGRFPAAVRSSCWLAAVSLLSKSAPGVASLLPPLASVTATSAQPPVRSLIRHCPTPLPPFEARQERAEVILPRSVKYTRSGRQVSRRWAGTSPSTRPAGLTAVEDARARRQATRAHTHRKSVFSK